MKRKIYLVDPVGGGIEERPGMIIVRHNLLAIVGEIDVRPEIVTNPGELRVTHAPLLRLTAPVIESLLTEHLKGIWWNAYKEDRAENDKANQYGGTIINVNRERGVYCITYPGDNTTLIDSDEY